MGLNTAMAEGASIASLLTNAIEDENLDVLGGCVAERMPIAEVLLDPNSLSRPHEKLKYKTPRSGTRRRRISMAGHTINQLREQVRGDVIAPQDEGYEQARRVYNARIDRRPGVLVRPVNTRDVVAAVSHARDNSIDLSVRGGGHSVPGYGT